VSGALAPRYPDARDERRSPAPMKTRAGTLACLVPLLCACSATRAVRSAGAPDSLALLKKLEGTWVQVDERGLPTADVVYVYRVTAAGNAVEEALHPGSPEEMVTVYFVDDGALQLTHYCTLGNRPRMVAQPASGADELEFRCDGSGVADEDEPHMHSLRIALGSDGRLRTRWQMHDQGRPTDRAEFTVVRR